MMPKRKTRYIEWRTTGGYTGPRGTDLSMFEDVGSPLDPKPPSPETDPESSPTTEAAS